MAEIVPSSNADSVAIGVALFLQSLLDDPLVSWAFDGVDQLQLERHALAFVIAALGGPDLYVGREMRAVHEQFHLRNEHFDAAVVHLIASLGTAGISEGVLSALAVRLEPLRSQIVTT